MDNIKIGKYIKKLRQNKHLTQKELAKNLNISFQAVSKWENGETLPDTSMLLSLCDLLDTTVDLLLNGGEIENNKRKLINVSDIIFGFEAMETIKNSFGEDSLFYKGMIEGINKIMNMDIEDALINHKDVLYTEVILQSIIFDNKTVSIDDVKKHIKNEKMVNIIEKELAKIH